MKVGQALAQSRAHEEDSEGQGQSPVLLKIKEILKSTDPNRWGRAGAALNPNSTYPKALENWEQVYTLDLPNGVLVLRSSTPVDCKFVRGGFLFTPKAAERFLIELRPQGWNPKELIDPYHRGGVSRGEKKHETLAEGQYARELFMDVKDRYEKHTRTKQEDLNAVTANLLESLAYGRTAIRLEDWEQTTSEISRSVYQGKIDGVSIELSKVINEGLDSYHAVCSRDGLQTRVSATRALQDLYLRVEEVVRLSQLEALSKILEPLG